MSTPFTPDFKHHIHYRLDESTRMITRCFEQLSEEQCWKKPKPSLNTVGNLILHLCGNIRQYAIASLGQQVDTRQRDTEFAHNEPIPKAALLQRFLATIQETKHIVDTVSESELLRKRQVQCFHFSGIGILIHVVEHLSYHTGQIAWMTKFYQEKDLGFYEGMDLTAKND